MQDEIRNSDVLGILRDDSRIAGEALETLVDRYGLQSVIDALAAICYEKGAHLRSNWQDAGMAVEWERDARAIERVKTHRQGVVYPIAIEVRS